MVDRRSTSGTDRTVARRTVLGGAALAGVTALAGCFGDDEPSGPDPITIEAGQACDNCTMEVVDYPGPVGQSFYDAAEEILGEDRPAQFCSTRCTYAFLFEQGDAGHDPEIVYVTDYSSVEYTIDPGGEDPVISSHVEAEAFAPVDGLSLVVDSEVHGAMEASMIGFSDADEAADFEADHGGSIYEHDDVSRELLSSLM